MQNIREYIQTASTLNYVVPLSVKTSVLDGLFSPLRGDHTFNTQFSVLFKHSNMYSFFI